MSYQNKGSEKQINKVLSALYDLCQSEQNHTSLPPQVQWPKTREIAEYCEITIYRARYYLLRLVEKEKAYVNYDAINNSLRWYITDNSPLSRKNGKRTEQSIIAQS